MNRCFLLVLGLLTCATGSGCYHYCNHNRGCVDWQGGCGADPGCAAAPSLRGARLQHHRPRTRDEIVEDDCSECDECGGRLRRGRDRQPVCDDCSRGNRRGRRCAPARDRRSRFCEPCGGTCTGTCGGEVSYGSCSSCSGGGYESQGYMIEGGAVPMGYGAAPMMGEGMPAPSSGCSGCSGGGSTSMYQGGTSYMGAPMYQGTVMNGQVISGGMPMDGSTGWVPASMPSSSISEPTPAPGVSGTVYSQTGSTAPPPGSFPTPAR